MDVRPSQSWSFTIRRIVEGSGGRSAGGATVIVGPVTTAAPAVILSGLIAWLLSCPAPPKPGIINFRWGGWAGFSLLMLLPARVPWGLTSRCELLALLVASADAADVSGDAVEALLGSWRESDEGVEVVVAGATWAAALPFEGATCGRGTIRSVGARRAVEVRIIRFSCICPRWLSIGSLPSREAVRTGGTWSQFRSS